MNPKFRRPTATIYQFPKLMGRKQPDAAKRQPEQRTVDVPRLPDSGWYHDAAVREAPIPFRR